VLGPLFYVSLYCLSVLTTQFRLIGTVSDEYPTLFGIPVIRRTATCNGTIIFTYSRQLQLPSVVADAKDDGLSNDMKAEIGRLLRVQFTWDAFDIMRQVGVPQLPHFFINCSVLRLLRLHRDSCLRDEMIQVLDQMWMEVMGRIRCVKFRRLCLSIFSKIITWLLLSRFFYSRRPPAPTKLMKDSSVVLNTARV
jgi:hypothetical protein